MWTTQMLEMKFQWRKPIFWLWIVFKSHAYTAKPFFDTPKPFYSEWSSEQSHFYSSEFAGGFQIRYPAGIWIALTDRSVDSTEKLATPKFSVSANCRRSSFNSRIYWCFICLLENGVTGVTESFITCQNQLRRIIESRCSWFKLDTRVHFLSVLCKTTYYTSKGAAGQTSPVWTSTPSFLRWQC